MVIPATFEGGSSLEGTDKANTIDTQTASTLKRFIWSELTILELFDKIHLRHITQSSSDFFDQPCFQRMKYQDLRNYAVLYIYFSSVLVE